MLFCFEIWLVENRKINIYFLIHWFHQYFSILCCVLCVVYNTHNTHNTHTTHTQHTQYTHNTQTTYTQHTRAKDVYCLHLIALSLRRNFSSNSTALLIHLNSAHVDEIRVYVLMLWWRPLLSLTLLWMWTGLMMQRRRPADLAFRLRFFDLMYFLAYGTNSSSLSLLPFARCTNRLRRTRDKNALAPPHRCIYTKKQDKKTAMTPFYIMIQSEDSKHVP